MNRHPGRSTQASNQINGKFFEEAFRRHGLLRGYLIQKNELSAKRIGGSRVVTMKSDLDFMVANKMGQVGFFDCKSFDSEYFTLCSIDARQAERSSVYWEWRIPTGFIVWFRPINKVCLFGPWLLEPRTRFGPGNCSAELGTIEDISLSKLFLMSAPQPEALRPPIDRGSCRLPSSRR